MRFDVHRGLKVYARFCLGRSIWRLFKISGAASRLHRSPQLLRRFCSRSLPLYTPDPTESWKSSSRKTGEGDSARVPPESPVRCIPGVAQSRWLASPPSIACMSSSTPASFWPRDNCKTSSLRMAMSPIYPSVKILEFIPRALHLIRGASDPSGKASRLGWNHCTCAGERI